MTLPDIAVPALDLQLQSLLIYRDFLQEEVGQRFLAIVQALRQTNSDGSNLLQAYGAWFQALAARQQGWQDYLCDRLFLADNPFSRQVQTTHWVELPFALRDAIRRDLTILQNLFACRAETICQWVLRKVPSFELLPTWYDTAPQSAPNPAPNAASTPLFFAQQALRTQLETVTNWAAIAPDLATYYQQYGFGPWAEYHAFRWAEGQLQGIAHADPIQPADLVGYEAQKAALMQNTEILLSGLPALHVLLYGSRGTGKSSLVKGLLQVYGDRGLRLIEVGKADLAALPVILAPLRRMPQKFIIFVDDLSFEADDDAFKALKVVLEGNLVARPQNVVVYATSNRRHLVREFFDERPRPSDADEVHHWDTVQEKLSFSDRFGLTLTFEPASQDTYLQMVQHLAHRASIAIDPADLQFQALQWATRHNGRSGRSARQFIDWLQGTLALQAATTP
jgi:uncharacterized protein